MVHPTPSDSESDDPIVRFLRRAFVGGLSLVVTFYGLCTLALLTYTTVDPWTTGVQIQRRLSGGDSYTKRYRPRPLSDLDNVLPLAVVAAEDGRFFQHNGVDWKAINKAFTENRNQNSERRGGSSITQQLVKNLFLTTHSTYVRKGLELPLTYIAELVLSKRRILELYLNVIEWGPGVFGAEAASRYHYGKTAQHLTRYQAAALAACIPNPRVRRPSSIHWYTRIILRRMDQIGTIQPYLQTRSHRIEAVHQKRVASYDRTETTSYRRFAPIARQSVSNGHRPTK